MIPINLLILLIKTTFVTKKFSQPSDNKATLRHTLYLVYNNLQTYCINHNYGLLTNMYTLVIYILYASDAARIFIEDTVVW